VGEEQERGGGHCKLQAGWRQSQSVLGSSLSIATAGHQWKCHMVMLRLLRLPGVLGMSGVLGLLCRLA